jgi:hypothetical protein
VHSRYWSTSFVTPAQIRSAIQTIFCYLVDTMNQSMDDVNYAIRLNDEGVLRMVEGKEQAAVTLFSQSLSIISTFLQSDTRGPAPANETTRSPEPKKTESPVDTSSPVYQMGSFVHSKVLPLSGMQKEDDTSFLYCNALALCPEGPHQQSRQVALWTKQDEDQCMLRAYAASIVFNLALVYHRRGRNNLKQICFRKALTMYDMVRKLLVAEPVLIGACNKSSTGTSLLLLVAAVNNASQIRFDQGDYADAQEGLQWMGGMFHRYSATVGDASEDLVMNDTTSTDHEYSSPNRRHSERQHIMEDHEMQGFLLNVLLLCAPSVAAAA